jgi:hypothetical protein
MIFWRYDSSLLMNNKDAECDYFRDSRSTGVRRLPNWCRWGFVNKQTLTAWRDIPSFTMAFGERRQMGMPSMQHA